MAIPVVINGVLIQNFPDEFAPLISILMRLGNAVDPQAVQDAVNAAVAATLVKASQAEAEAGTENTKVMTALRVAQAIDFQVGSPLGAQVAGQFIVYGTVIPDSDTTDIDLGNASIPRGVVFVLSGAPTMTHMHSALDLDAMVLSPGHIIIKHYKPTAANDVTPIAATTPWRTVSYFAVTS